LCGLACAHPLIPLNACEGHVASEDNANVIF
jgi:hypothetical protein